MFYKLKQLIECLISTSQVFYFQKFLPSIELYQYNGVFYHTMAYDN